LGQSSSEDFDRYEVFIRMVLGVVNGDTEAFWIKERRVGVVVVEQKHAPLVLGR
jgi:hypothetical protein